MASEPLDRQQLKLITYGAFLCDISPNETYNNFKEKGVEKLPSRGSIHRWFKLFKNGERSFGDKPRSGRPKSATNQSSVQAVQECVLKDKSLSIMKLSNATGLKKSTVGKILKKELRLKKTPKTKVWTPAKKKPDNNGDTQDNSGMVASYGGSILEQVASVIVN